jgi:recombination protein RecR
MVSRPESLENLLNILRTLPSVGPKMSERIAFYILKAPEEEVRQLVETIQETYQKVRPCPICGYWDDTTPCRICQDLSRDPATVCVVESPQDLIAMSRIRGFRGLYHVLGGALSPLDGVGPQDLRIDALMKRLEEQVVREVILALNPDIEGETTSQYLAKQISILSQKLENHTTQPRVIKVTRLAQGLPAGGELEYMDEMTLMRAFDGRNTL